ncbi:phosphatase PAP2 family protein [Spirillospora sp. CA-294931]|uniref:phosphatase PAP2 family protein n=1 Tax=Spirillospora sp. CA-294931 TaxID=3240042 RepID=UPI003D8F613E
MTDRIQARALRRAPVVRGAAVEAVTLAVLLVAYLWVRQLAQGQDLVAESNAARVWTLERLIGLPDETRVQAWALSWPPAARFANLYYVGVHFPGTAAAMVWLFVRHRAAYSRVRAELVVLTAAGLALHVVLPLAPPRLAGVGAVDTMLSVGPSAYPAAGEGVANQYAAMPSLHVGWALLVAVAVIRAGTSPARRLVVLHPLLTTFTVVVTANHYWLDAVAAALLLAAAVQVAGRWSRPEEEARRTALGCVRAEDRPPGR